MLYDQGLDVVSLESPADDKGNRDGKQLKLKLKIAPDCRLGAQRLRVRTATGMSNLRVFHVSALPTLAEKEPNTDFAEPQTIDANVTVEGRIDREDVDYFAVDAKQGQRLSVEIFGMRMGMSGGTNYFDPYVAILDSDRKILVKNDDTPLVWNDAVASLVVPKDGRYIIELRDSAYNGDGAAFYRLHVGHFPRPLAIVPAGGKPGETVSVTFLGDPAGAMTREVPLPAEIPEQFGVTAEDEHGVAPSWNWFRLSPLDNTIEAEPNNTWEEATPAAAPGAYNGVLNEGDQWDYFTFAATKDQELDIEVYARRIRSALDPVLYIHDASNGKQLASNDDVRGPDSYLRFKAPADGEYTVALCDHLYTGSDAHTYRIEITPVTPTVIARPIEFARYVQPQLVIPQGGARGIVVNVQRQDFGGPVNFRGENLPAGVSIECPEGWRNGGTMPVVFFAADDAPVAGTYATLTTFLADPNQADRVITGPLAQNNLMIRGQNAERVWEEEEVRMPVVVTAAAPFKVRLVPPSVPIVQGGSMNLKVIAERSEGFVDEIKVDVLQDPAGCSSSRSINIPKEQSEVDIPINAAGNAAVGESMIAVRATAKVGNGTMESCTTFVPLRVEEQYITFEFQAAAVEQGRETPLAVKVTKRKDFEGEAEVELLGLPAKTTAEKLKLTRDTPELIFTVKTEGDSPEGNHKNLLCRVMIPENGDSILHNLGTGRLRIDKPAPAPTNAPPATAQAPEPTAKPLSRLEQLRQAQQAREAAAASGGGE